MSSRLLVLGFLLGGACSAPTGPAGDTPDAGLDPDADSLDEAPRMRLLQANVGNLSADCLDYAFNLCSIQIEDRFAERIREIDPDVVALQEIVSDAQCDELGTEPDATKVCHAARRAVEPAQVRRLLGPAYSITCDTRRGFECIGVHQRFGDIEGCQPGGLCFLADTADAGDGCDPGFSISAATLILNDGMRVRLVNGHPPSGNAIGCRRDQLERAFVGVESLAPAGKPTIAAGDFNLDPFSGSDASVQLWNQLFGPTRRLQYHSGPAEQQPPYSTSFSLLGAQVFDHVASDFAEGVCQTLGEAPGTERLDGGGGSDHRALLCDLHF